MTLQPQRARRYAQFPLPDSPYDSRYESGASLASAVVSALHVFPSVGTCGDWYLFQQRLVRQLRLPGLLGSDFLFLLSPLCVVLAGQRHFLPSLQQQGGCSAFGSSLLSPRCRLESKVLWGVVSVFWGTWFVGSKAIQVVGAVGTSFAKALVVPSAYAMAIQAVGVEVVISVGVEAETSLVVVAVVVLGVGDFCL